MPSATALMVPHLWPDMKMLRHLSGRLCIRTQSAESAAAWWLCPTQRIYTSLCTGSVRSKSNQRDGV
jgi:hypothetical protein